MTAPASPNPLPPRAARLQRLLQAVDAVVFCRSCQGPGNWGALMGELEWLEEIADILAEDHT